MHVLRRAVSDHAPGAPDELRVVFKGIVITLDRNRLDRIRNDLHRRSRGSVNAARGRAAEMLLDALWRRFNDVGGPEAAEAEESAEAESGRHAMWNAILAADGLASIDEEPATGQQNGDPKRAQFDTRVREQRTFTDFLVTWWPIRRPLDVLRSLGDPSRLRRVAYRDLDRADIDPLAASWAEGAPLRYQDVALLDELDALLGRPARPAAARPRPRTTRSSWTASTSSPARRSRTRRGAGDAGADHVHGAPRTVPARGRRRGGGASRIRAHRRGRGAGPLPMQWRMLGRRGRQASWTIVEDPAQSAWEDLDAARQAMETALGGERPSRGRRRTRKPARACGTSTNSPRTTATPPR